MSEAAWLRCKGWCVVETVVLDVSSWSLEQPARFSVAEQIALSSFSKC